MKEIKLKKTDRKNIVIAATLAAFLLIGSTMAYFIDRDTVRNEFTVGNVDISVSEPLWNPDDAVKITPNKELAKDPKVTNNGVNDAYVFMSVKVPRAEVKTAASDGTVNSQQNQDLFQYKLNQGWSLIKTNKEGASSEYIYVYGTENEMTRLVPEASTGALFDKVKFINIIEGQLEEENLNIDVKAMAIQTDDLGSTRPEEVYNIITKQI